MKNIALIDDDEIFAVGLSRKFAARDVELQHFKNPRKFLAIEDPDIFGAILVDLRMEDMSGVYWKFAGLDAIRAIRRDCEIDAPICVFTAQPNHLIAKTTLLNGADAYIEKDAPLDEILATLRQVGATPATIAGRAAPVASSTLTH